MRLAALLCAAVAAVAAQSCQPGAVYLVDNLAGPETFQVRRLRSSGLANIL